MIRIHCDLCGQECGNNPPSMTLGDTKFPHVCQPCLTGFQESARGITFYGLQAKLADRCSWCGKDSPTSDLTLVTRTIPFAHAPTVFGICRGCNGRLDQLWRQIELQGPVERG